MSDIKFWVTDQQPTYTTVTQHEFRIESDVAGFVNQTVFQDAKTRLPSVLSNDVPGMTPEGWPSVEDFNNAVSILKAAERAKFATTHLDQIFRRIGIVYPASLNIYNLSPEAKLEFFRFLVEDVLPKIEN